MAQLKLSAEYAEEFISLAEVCGGDVRNSYSGRGMYGKDCLGVEFDRSSELFEFLFELGRISNDPNDETLGDFWSDHGLAGATKTDSMGLGIIAYWERLEALPIPDENNDDE